MRDGAFEVGLGALLLIAGLIGLRRDGVAEALGPSHELHARQAFVGPTVHHGRLRPMTASKSFNDAHGLYNELLDLVPPHLHGDFGEVFYSGATAFAQPAPIYLLGFNPGGDPSKAGLSHYTIGSDLDLARTPERRDWSGFEDDWRDFGPGAVAFQRRVRHLMATCNIGNPRKVPSSNLIFVRSARVETLDAGRTKTLLRECWRVHRRVIAALNVRVVVCLGRATGQWVQSQLGAIGSPTDTFVENNQRRWRSATHLGRDGIQVVTLTHPSVADWTNPRTDPTGLVAQALRRARG